MKNLPLKLLGITLISTCLATSLAAQDKAMLKAFPELGKPIVQMQALESTSGAESDPDIYAICSRTKPGVAELYVKKPVQLKSSDNIRLDVTVFKTGFSTNKYALLYKSTRTKALDPKSLPQREVMKSLDLSTMPLTVADTNQNVLYKLEGLNPGMTYFLRILKEGKDAWESTDIIRIEAPTCPVDKILGHK